MVDRHSPAEEKRRFVAAFEPRVAAASGGHAPVTFGVVDLGLQYHAPLDDLDPDLVLTFDEARCMSHAELRNRFHDIVEEMKERFWPGELPGDFPWEEGLAYSVGEMLRLIDRFGVWFDPTGPHRLPKDWYGTEPSVDHRQLKFSF